MRCCLPICARLRASPSENCRTILVFLSNSYFETVGESITRAGGTIDKFIGDGVMALFGVEVRTAEGCRQALAAAMRMVEQVDALSQALAGELAEPLKIGVVSTVARRWWDAWDTVPVFISRQSVTPSTWPADFRI